MNKSEKIKFLRNLKLFAGTLSKKVTLNNEWIIRGFIDIAKKIYPLSTDSKLVSKILEIHLFPELLKFAEQENYKIEPASRQNYYPDFTFISKHDSTIKFAVDLKTTYRDEKYPDFCNGFTLGSHGEYFIERDSTKNIEYPYNSYSGHFCLGLIYSRNVLKTYDTQIYYVSNIDNIPAVIKNFVFFAAEKWTIASDKGGSGNTANIGRINYIDDILHDNGVFAKAGEELFNDYWINFGKISIQGKNGAYKKLSSFSEYLLYRGLPETLNNPRKLRCEKK